MVRGGDRASSTEFGLDRDHGFRADSASVARRSRDYLARRAQSRGSLRELRAPDGGVGTTSLRGNNDAGPLSVNRGQANLEPSASGRHRQLTTWLRSSVEFPEQLTGPRASPSVSQPYHAFPAPDGSRGSPKDTSLVDFVFARTMRESVGHRRTRHRHGSGP